MAQTVQNGAVTEGYVPGAYGGNLLVPLIFTLDIYY